MKNLEQFKDNYYDLSKVTSGFPDEETHEEFQNQSPYDLIANYSEKERKELIGFCKENFQPIKSKRLSTYTLKHWAEHCLNHLGLSYVSTGAMKGALLLSGFELDPYKFNANVNIGSAYYIKKKVHQKYGVGHWANDNRPQVNWNMKGF